jgi:hypothetical protein
MPAGFLMLSSNPEMKAQPRSELMNILAEIKTVEGQSLAVFTVPAKEFKTGSRGYYANGKADFDGKRYQVQIQIVEIGSKKKAEAEDQ